MVKRYFRKNISRKGILRKPVRKSRAAKKNKYTSKYFPKKVAITNSIVPDRFFTKLKATLNLSRAPGAVVDVLSVSGTSLVDPFLTLGAAQPIGFDQLAALYNRYRVRGASCKLRVFNTMASNSIVTTMRPVPQGGSASTTMQQATEMPFAQKRLMTAANGTPEAFIKNYMSTTKINGWNKIYSGDDMATTVTSSENLFTWEIVSGTVDQSTNITYEIQIELVFYCEFYQRKTLADA